jgi:hypothetical protein
MESDRESSRETYMRRDTWTHAVALPPPPTSPLPPGGFIAAGTSHQNPQNPGGGIAANPCLSGSSKLDIGSIYSCEIWVLSARVHTPGLPEDCPGG